jgi:hypothetical protein
LNWLWNIWEKKEKKNTRERWCWNICFEFQTGFCCVYVIFLGQNTTPFIDSLFDTSMDWRIIALFWFPLLVLLSWIRRWQLNTNTKTQI